MAKLKAEEIRQKLQTDHGYTKERVKEIVGIANLRQELNKAMYQIKDLDDIEEAMEEVGNDETNGAEEKHGQKQDEDGEISPRVLSSSQPDSRPAMTSPEWSNFVMAQFEDDELYDGNPTVDGLRRVAELVIGPILSINSRVVQCPTPENEKRATVEVSVEFSQEYQDRAYCGCADSYFGNTTRDNDQNQYRNFPVANAETRAEGRALKRALRLRKIVSAEEVSADFDDNLDAGITVVEQISETQINVIEIMCRKNNINVKQFVDKEGVRNLINETVKSEAVVMIQLLNTYQQSQDAIPPEILGFDTEWRENYYQ